MCNKIKLVFLNPLHLAQPQLGIGPEGFDSVNMRRIMSKFITAELNTKMPFCNSGTAIIPVFVNPFRSLAPLNRYLTCQDPLIINTIKAMLCLTPEPYKGQPKEIISKPLERKKAWQHILTGF